jgi:hypothetical protein
VYWEMRGRLGANLAGLRKTRGKDGGNGDPSPTLRAS